MSDNRSQFTIEVLRAIQHAFAYALEKRYEYVTIDNLMLFIADTPKGKDIFQSIGIDVNHYKEEVKKYLEENTPKFSKDNIDERPEPTVAFHRTLEQATILQKAASHAKTEESYIIISLFELKREDAFTLNYFQHFDIKRVDVMLYLSHGKKKNATKIVESKDSKESEPSRTMLEKHGVLLNEKAKQGKIDPIVGREEEVSRVIEILAQRKKNNPILVGDAGVGKTAIAEGLAKRIVEGNVPEMFKESLIYSLDLTSVVAGSRYRGDFEEKLKGILKEASNNPNIILFIDEIHTLIGAGTSNGTMDASNIMKPALSSGEIKVIGATTYEEYRKYFEKEAALNRRFQKVDIVEPSSEQTIEILKGLAPHYEKFHKVKYDVSALLAAVKLTEKYINDKKFPDKAIDVIDMAGARAKLNKKTKVTITEKDITQIISGMINIPINEVDISDKIKLKNLHSELNNEIFGQAEAVEKVVDSIILSRASLTTKDKPIGSFLFAGPSGVGKTELAKQLSKNLNIPLIRFDMSEYMEEHNVAKFIGSPPGYRNSEDGGLLTEAIRKTPHAVLLLDEIEKADSNILNILLQVMDYGILTDNHGNKADFKNIILIMTSNIGAKEISKNVIGFSKIVDIAANRENEIKKVLSPEFYNRLDSVIQFNPLLEVDIDRVVVKQLKKLQLLLAEKRIAMLYSPELITHIVKNGFDEKLGARPIERYIEHNISQSLAREILFGNLEKGGEVNINIVDNTIAFEYPHIKTPEAGISKNLEPSIIDEVKKPVRRKKAVKSEI